MCGVYDTHARLQDDCRPCKRPPISLFCRKAVLPAQAMSGWQQQKTALTCLPAEKAIFSYKPQNPDTSSIRAAWWTRSIAKLFSVEYETIRAAAAGRSCCLCCCSFRRVTHTFAGQLFAGRTGLGDAGVSYLVFGCPTDKRADPCLDFTQLPEKIRSRFHRG